MDTDFVKNLRETHCKGCRSNVDIKGVACSCCQVIDCWLRKTYLPQGEWSKACHADMIANMTNDIARDIDNKIIESIIGDYGNKA